MFRSVLFTLLSMIWSPAWAGTKPLDLSSLQQQLRLRTTAENPVIEHAAFSGDGRWLAMTFFSSAEPGGPNLERAVAVVEFLDGKPRLYRLLESPKSIPQGTPHEISIIEGRFVRVQWQSQTSRPPIRDYEFLDLATNERFTLKQRLNLNNQSVPQAYSDHFYVIRAVFQINSDHLNEAFPIFEFNPATGLRRPVGTVPDRTLGKRLVQIAFQHGFESQQREYYVHPNQDSVLINTFHILTPIPKKPNLVDIQISISKEGAQISSSNIEDRNVLGWVENGHGKLIPAKLKDLNRVTSVLGGYAGIKRKPRSDWLHWRYYDDISMKLESSSPENHLISHLQFFENGVIALGYEKENPSRLMLFRHEFVLGLPVSTQLSVAPPPRRLRPDYIPILYLRSAPMSVVQIDDHTLGYYHHFLEELIGVIRLSSSPKKIQENQNKIEIIDENHQWVSQEIPRVSEHLAGAVACDLILRHKAPMRRFTF